MNKFEHLTTKDLKSLAKFSEITLEVQDHSFGVNTDLPNLCYEHKDIAKITFEGTNAQNKIVQILNAALDAHLVQRVIDEPKNDDKSEKIEDKYTLKTLPDGQVWMLENLREKVDGAVWNEKYNCYMYSWEQAKQAVPKGFHLPSAREYMRLALALGYLNEDDEVVAERLQEECGFTLAGYATPQRAGRRRQLLVIDAEQWHRRVRLVLWL